MTVLVEDAYGNLVSSDNTDTVTVAIGANPGSGVLSGTTTVTVSGGVATFSNLAISKIGTGYTLKASSGLLTGATSASFNVTNSSTTIEDFEAIASDWNTSGLGDVNAYQASWAAHDGNYGLDLYAGTDWLYRNDAAVQVKKGDTISVWFAFDVAADGRAYFGFGTSAGGTLSIVAAPNTGQLIIQKNVNFGFTNLAAVAQTYKANHWYRLEVDWGTSGKIIGRLFDSNGTTLLKSVSATTNVITSGGIAFRAIGDDKYFDTVTARYGVNSFALSASNPLAADLFAADGAAAAIMPPLQVFVAGPTANLTGLEEAHVRNEGENISPTAGQTKEESSSLDFYFTQYSQEHHSNGWEGAWTEGLNEAFFASE